MGITNGTVRIMQRVQIAEYQPREVEITISFSVPEGAAYEEWLDEAQSVCSKRVAAELGLTKPAKATVTQHTAAPHVAAEKATEEVKEPKPRGRPKAEKPLKENEVPALNPEDVVITDAEVAQILSHIRSKANEGKITGVAPEDLRSIVNKYTGVKPGEAYKTAIEIPKDRRPAFMAEMKLLMGEKPTPAAVSYDDV